MKSIFTLLLAALAFVATAQPQKINYQGVAVGANGKPMKYSTVGLRLSVLDSLPTGSTLYTETQTASTDVAGQFSIFLGGGTATAGAFANLPWANGNDKFLKVEMDAQGGSNYQTMGTTQLVSVPYAMAAGSLREGALLYGNNGQQFRITIDSTGPKWTLVPQPTVPFSCDQPVAYVGEIYPTVLIGTQCWFAKNLNVGTMISGYFQSNNSTIEKYCPNDDSSNCTTYGGYYQWAEAVQYQNGARNTISPNPAFTGNVRGICPPGWYLPSDADWRTLETILGGISVAGGKLKSTSVLWTSPNIGATNSSGFSAFPIGYYYYNSAIIGDFTYFWSSSESSASTAIGRYLFHSMPDISWVTGSKENGFPVRCVKDTLCPPTQSSAGPDQLSLKVTTTTLAANAPTAGETGTWSIISGSGGSLNSSTNPTATFTKGTDSAYTLVWTITGPCGISLDTVNLLFPIGLACGQVVVNYAGENYPTVEIGSKCWFKKNLNVGNLIVVSSNQTNNSTIEKYCYNNDLANCNMYGGLFQWAEAVQYQNGASNFATLPTSFTGNVQGICPIDWHLPSDAEWSFLESALGGSSVAGGALKSTSSWNTPNTGATNSSSFSAIPAGYRNIYGFFGDKGNSAFFWSSSESSDTNSISRSLSYFNSNIGPANGVKKFGFSVRCIQD